MFEKGYNLDDVGSELLGYKITWSRTNVLRIADLTLKYNGLCKIALVIGIPPNISQPSLETLPHSCLT